MTGEKCVICKKQRDGSTRLYGFPHDQSRRKQCILRIDESCEQKCHIKICCDHFDKKMISRSGRVLHKDALPTSTVKAKLQDANDFKYFVNCCHNEYAEVHMQACNNDSVNIVTFSEDYLVKKSKHTFKEEPQNLFPDTATHSASFHSQSASVSSRSVSVQTPKKLLLTSPRKAKLRSRISILQKKIKRQNAALHQLRSDHISKHQFLHSAKELLSPELALLVESHVKNSSRGVNGYRFSQEMKDFCLGIYFTSPSTYRSLRKKLILPSGSILRLHALSNIIAVMVP